MVLLYLLVSLTHISNKISPSSKLQACQATFHYAAHPLCALYEYKAHSLAIASFIICGVMFMSEIRRNINGMNEIVIMYSRGFIIYTYMR